jgi:hypothetical protein
MSIACILAQLTQNIQTGVMVGHWHGDEMQLPDRVTQCLKRCCRGRGGSYKGGGGEGDEGKGEEGKEEEGKQEEGKGEEGDQVELLQRGRV